MRLSGLLQMGGHQNRYRKDGNIKTPRIYTWSLRSQVQVGSEPSAEVVQSSRRDVSALL